MHRSFPPIERHLLYFMLYVRFQLAEPLLILNYFPLHILQHLQDSGLTGTGSSIRHYHLLDLLPAAGII
jgi:hypothetical protein